MKGSTTNKSRLVALGGVLAAHLAVTAAGCFDDNKQPSPDTGVVEDDAGSSEPFATGPDEIDAGFANGDDLDREKPLDDDAE